MSSFRIGDRVLAGSCPTYITAILANPGNGGLFTILTQRTPASPVVAWAAQLVADYPALAAVA
jgi:hypothetical protein